MGETSGSVYLVVWTGLISIVQKGRFKMVLCNREEPFACEPLNCCSPSLYTQPKCLEPMASSWVL